MRISERENTHKGEIAAMDMERVQTDFNSFLHFS